MCVWLWRFYLIIKMHLAKNWKTLADEHVSDELKKIGQTNLGYGT